MGSIELGSCEPVSIVMMHLDRLFLLPLFGHFALVLALYVWLTLVRQRAVKAGDVNVSDFVRVDGDPTRARAIQRNLANQFELPMFAYFAAAVLLAWNAVTWLDVAAAWLFMSGRVAHTLVQTLTSNVPLRGQVYMLTLFGVGLLMARVAWLALLR